MKSYFFVWILFFLLMLFFCNKERKRNKDFEDEKTYKIRGGGVGFIRLIVIKRELFGYKERLCE